MFSSCVNQRIPFICDGLKLILMGFLSLSSKSPDHVSQACSGNFFKPRERSFCRSLSGARGTFSRGIRSSVPKLWLLHCWFAFPASTALSHFGTRSLSEHSAHFPPSSAARSLLVLAPDCCLESVPLGLALLLLSRCSRAQLLEDSILRMLACSVAV